MQIPYKLVGGLALLSLLVGCQSPVQPMASAGAIPTTTPLRPDDRILFNSINPSNQPPREWLVVPTNFFRLGPGDLVDVEIIGEATSASTALVGPDGKIYYSMLDGTFVWGLTLGEAKDLIEANLAKFVRVRPEVSLTLKTVGSRKVWLLGSVRKPGVYPLAAPVTLLEAVAAAGGTGSPAEATVPGLAFSSTEDTTDLENSFIIREGKLLPIDFARLLRQGDLSQNIYLQPDDFVYLRPTVSRGDIYVLGAVLSPNVVDYRPHITLMSAISAVGGPADYAYRGHVAVVRGSLAHPAIATVSYSAIVNGKALDLELQPGDIVYVPFSPYRRLEIFANEILNTFVYTIAVNEGTRSVIRGASPLGVAAPPISIH